MIRVWQNMQPRMWETLLLVALTDKLHKLKLTVFAKLISLFAPMAISKMPGDTQVYTGRYL